MAKRRADWEAIEREYRAGQLSIREIARRYEVTDTAIRKRAKRDGWERDLSEQVAKRVRNESVRSEVRKDNANDEEIIERFAQRGAEVEQMQRGQVRSLLAVGDALLEEVQTAEIDLPKRTSCFRDLSQAAARLIPLQRQMYRLDEEADSSDSLADQLQKARKRAQQIEHGDD